MPRRAGRNEWQSVRKAPRWPMSRLKTGASRAFPAENRLQSRASRTFPALCHCEARSDEAIPLHCVWLCMVGVTLITRLLRCARNDSQVRSGPGSQSRSGHDAARLAMNHQRAMEAAPQLAGFGAWGNIGCKAAPIGRFQHYVRCAMCHCEARSDEAIPLH